MNYTGGKFKLLDYIIPSIPKQTDKFVDLFAGGLNVGINIESHTIYANDQISYLIELYRFFQENDIDNILDKIEKQIDNFDLSQTNCDGYNSLRVHYNKKRDILDLFILACYSFNHQIRFNSKHEFNTPFGKNRSSYNASIKQNLIRFCSALHEKNIILSQGDFRKFNFQNLKKNDFVYCDPPYLITTGSYNDGKRGFQDWTKTEDEDLQKLLDTLNAKGVFFAMSNVFLHKDQRNNSLINWSKKYQVQFLDKSYSNCSYHFKNRDSITTEVLITNYEVENIKCNQTSLPL